jgi:DNA-directed RNA polymerase specialized sigma24 family protein
MCPGAAPRAGCAMTGELHRLLEECRAEQPVAWERFAAWVRTRGRSVLGGIQALTDADGEDVVADALSSLVTVIRGCAIRGTSDAEIDAYVCAAIRNRALNVLRARARRRGAGESTAGPRDADRAEPAAEARAADESPAPDAKAVAAAELERAEQLLLSWPPEDRYLFLAKLHGVPAKVIQATLERAPFHCFAAVTTVDTRFHRLRKRLMEHLAAS